MTLWGYSDGKAPEAKDVRRPPGRNDKNLNFYAIRRLPVTGLLTASRQSIFSIMRKKKLLNLESYKSRGMTL